jgi:poly(hydroxyalkanoate) granule-associated protein
MAEEEGGKLFKALVEKGEQFEGKSKDQVARAKDAVAGVKTRAGSYLEGFEARIDERMTAVIHRLGVPTKDEIEKLTKKVEQLTKSVDRLRAKDATSARPRPAKTDSPATD